LCKPPPHMRRKHVIHQTQHTGLLVEDAFAVEDKVAVRWAATGPAKEMDLAVRMKILILTPRAIRVTRKVRG
jgi:hypothetical protein